MLRRLLNRTAVGLINIAEKLIFIAEELDEQDKAKRLNQNGKAVKLGCLNGDRKD